MNPQIKKLHIPNMSFRKALREIGRNANVDWVIVCIASFTVAVVLIIFSINLYFDMVSGKLGKDTVIVKDEKTFSKKNLDIVVKMISDKSIARDKIRSSYNSLRDPSI